MQKNHKSPKLLKLLAVCTLVFSFNAIPLTAGEHPEHPEQAKQTEHPEHPAKQTVDINMMAQAISNYVDTDTDLKGGYFLIFDKKAETPLLLKLTKVHKERLAQVGDNLYFACCDFRERSGKMYDLDFFMEAKEGKLLVTEVMVHKEDAKPRYRWFEENGIWKRK